MHGGCIGLKTIPTPNMDKSYPLIKEKIEKKDKNDDLGQSPLTEARRDMTSRF